MTPDKVKCDLANPRPYTDEYGYVELPNVDLVKEITDGTAARQAFSANVTAFNLLKCLVSGGLKISKFWLG